MPAIIRAPKDFVFGTLSTAAALSDNTVSSTAFAALPTTYSPTFVLPMILLNPAGNTYEVVWVTGHTSGSSVVNIVRGKEGTTAQAWPSGTQIICAPTAARDTLGTFVSTAAPTDLHVGYRGVATDLGLVQEQTNLGGLQPSVGVANPHDIGTNRAGTAPPANAAMVMRAGYFAATTDASGKFTLPFTTPFPNSILIGGVSEAGGGQYPTAVVSETAAGLVVQAFLWTSFSNVIALGSGQVFDVAYWAVGW